MEELKKLLEEQMKAFHEFKKANDERLRLLETKGYSPADLEEKLTKINENLDRLEVERKKAQDEIEKKLGRIELGGAGAGEPDQQAAERKAAIAAYLRRGLTESKSLIRGDDTAGGYLMGTETDTAIIRAAQIISPVRDLVTVQPISKQSIKEPKLTNAPAMAAKTGEIQTRTESTNPAYGVVEIPTHEFYAMHKISHQALEDADYNLEGEIAEFMGWQFGLREANDVVKGTGVGEARGFTDPGAGVAYTPSGTSATIADANGVADGLLDLVHAVKEAYAVNGVFVLNRKSLGAVRKLKDGQKQYVWQPGVANGAPPTILGYRYVQVAEMDDEGTNKFPIAFGDFKRAYKFHPRIASTILRDPYSLSDSGLVKFTAYRRHGGDVVLAEAIRLLKCATS